MEVPFHRFRGKWRLSLGITHLLNVITPGFGTQNSLTPGVGRTNAVLNDDQAWRIREHLTDVQDELRQWHRDFAVLLATRPRIVDRVYRCKIALAPYKKLPAEITREIMLFVVGVPPSFPLPNYKAAAMDPRLQLTQVCADWRRIAFDITELWKIAFSRIPAGSSPSKLINAWWSHCSGSRLSLVMNKSYLRNSKGLFFGISSNAFLF